jgi:CBS-domain-containing membrane protein
VTWLPIVIGAALLLLAGLLARAAAVHRAHVAARALSGVRMRDIMMRSPAAGAGRMSIGDFIEHVALRSSQTVFPVIGAHGDVIGVVALSMLSRVPPPARLVTPLEAAAVPVPPAYLAGPDGPAAPLLARRPLAGEVIAVVTGGDGQIAGLVTVAQLHQALWRRLLHIQPVSHAAAHIP